MTSRFGSDTVPRCCDGRGQRRRQVVDGDARRQAGAFAAGDHPASIGVVEQQDRGGGELEEVAQAAHRRVEGLVEVERRRQRLGDSVQREEQRVRVGQAAEPIEGEGLLAIGLARDPPGVAGDEGDEHHPRGPLRRHPQLVVAVT